MRSSLCATLWLFCMLLTTVRASFPIVPLAAAVGGVAAAAGWWFLLLRPPNVLFTPEPDSLKGQTILITGGTTGLGMESAKRLAVGGARIVLTARSEAKGQAAVDQVRDHLRLNYPSSKDSSQQIDHKILDLDDLKGIQDSVKGWTDIERVDVLLNNAGIMSLPQRQLTVDGIERQAQSNHLGHFVLTALLAPKLVPTARIVVVSSDAYQLAWFSNGLHCDYLWIAERYNPLRSYSQSKLANVLFAQQLQRLSAAAGLDWAVSSVHPGPVATDIMRNFFGFPAYQDKARVWTRLFQAMVNTFILTVEQGASTQVFLAAGANQEAPQGRYYVNYRPVDVWGFAKDVAAAERLWKESEEMSGVRFEFAKLSSE
jgi:NAD(P)-dependent dehydrogenase (short-subunit alcohol dehydrogenase family)